MHEAKLGEYLEKIKLLVSGEEKVGEYFVKVNLNQLSLDAGVCFVYPEENGSRAEAKLILTKWLIVLSTIYFLSQKLFDEFFTNSMEKPDRSVFQETVSNNEIDELNSDIPLCGLLL